MVWEVLVFWLLLNSGSVLGMNLALLELLGKKVEPGIVLLDFIMREEIELVELRSKLCSDWCRMRWYTCSGKKGWQSCS